MRQTCKVIYENISRILMYTLAIILIRGYFILRKFNISRHTLSNDEWKSINMMFESKDWDDKRLGTEIVINSNLKFKHIFEITSCKFEFEHGELHIEFKSDILEEVLDEVFDRLEKKQKNKNKTKQQKQDERLAARIRNMS